MLINFETDVGRITLFGDVAVQLLRMMGVSGVVPSALLAADIASALAKLRQSLDAEDAARPQSPMTEEDEDQGSSVTLRNRAVPLIKLLEDAQRENSDVMWNT